MIDVVILIGTFAVKLGTENVMVDRSEEIKQKVKLAAAKPVLAEDWHNPTIEKSMRVVPVT